MHWHNLRVLDVVSSNMASLKPVLGKALLVDDYGHHPTEVRATLASARAAWPERRLVLISSLTVIPVPVICTMILPKCWRKLMC